MAIDIQKKIFQLSPELVEGRLENLLLKDYRKDLAPLDCPVWIGREPGQDFSGGV